MDNGIQIDAIDAMILEIIRDMPLSEKIEKRFIENTVYFWVNHKNLVEENKILGIKTPDGLYRRLVKLSELGLIHIHPDNQRMKKSFYAISDLFNNIFSHSTSDDRPNKVDHFGYKTEVTSDDRPNSTSDGKPKDNTINDNTINDNKKKKYKKENSFIKPTLNDVKDFFLSKGFNEDYAEMAFDYYDSADWKDSRGSKVVNWKQKMIANWLNSDKSKNYKIQENNLFTGDSSSKQMIY